MPTFYIPFTNRSNQALRFNVWQNSQSISNNTTNVGWSLRLDLTSGVGSFANDPSGSYTVSLNGIRVVDGKVFPAFNTQQNSQIWIDSGTRTFGHESDGSKTISLNAWASGVTVLGNTGSHSSLPYLYKLPTIPRTSSFTLSSYSFYPGSDVSISINRASTSFSHKVYYSWAGGGWVSINDSVWTSATWSPGWWMLNDIPNSTSGSGSIRVVTYHGNTRIGHRDRNYTLKVPTSVKPTTGTIALSESVTDVDTLVGEYVQGKTRLDWEISEASGAFSSTIESYKVQVSGQVHNSRTGTTGVIRDSGSVNVTRTVTDSRGRVSSSTSTVSVHPWQSPQLSSLTAERVTQAGVPHTEGQYLLISFGASVSPLTVGGSELNSLKYFIRTRPSGTDAWTVTTGWTDATDLTISPEIVIGNNDYLVTSSYDVQVMAEDIFGADSRSTTQTRVATATVTLDLGDNTVGIGKYWERGGLDLAGEFYQNGVRQVQTPWVETTGSGSSDTGPWARVLRVTLDTQYDSYDTTIRHSLSGEGSDVSVGEINFRLRQQGAFGEDPQVTVGVSLLPHRMSTQDYIAHIVQNSGPSIVDLYIQINQVYRSWDLHVVGQSRPEYATWFHEEALRTTPDGGETRWVRGSPVKSRFLTRHVQSGELSSGPTGGDVDYQIGSVTFPTPFPDGIRPTVVLTPQEVHFNRTWTAQATSVSSLGFDYRIAVVQGATSFQFNSNGLRVGWWAVSPTNTE